MNDYYRNIIQRLVEHLIRYARLTIDDITANRIT